ncbi:hypothetical protein ABT026_32050 [Streptomyces sp. NPDC002734]|uniref:hypothetical protein n=1 Tax=Streptomyces sp. NPDC002734 TaxID=3154426 RepID=UPI00332FF06D
MEHLDEAAFTFDAARSPAPEGGPEQQLRLELGGRDLFEVLDAERLDDQALKVVRSIEDELGERAAAAYHDLLGGH